MYELKKIGKVFTSKFVGTGPTSYKKRNYRTAVSQRLRNSALKDFWKSHFNIADAFYLIVVAWKEVSVRCLNSAWMPLWPNTGSKGLRGLSTVGGRACFAGNCVSGPFRGPEDE